MRFRVLFAAVSPALCRYGFVRGLTKADTEDLVSEVLAIAWRRLDVVPARGSDAVAVRGGAQRAAQSASERGALRGLDAAGADQGVTYPVDPPSSPSMEMIRRAMAVLSDDDQELLRLVAWDGLTPAQVAVALGCTSAVEVTGR
jgi:RNA polymerase sigma-70 factor, ECF subfamily